MVLKDWLETASKTRGREPVLNLSFMSPICENAGSTQESLGLVFSAGELVEQKQTLFRWSPRAADPINGSLIAFQQLSSTLPQLTRRESRCFFIWIVTVRNGFGEMLVSCWFSHLSHSFLAHNFFLQSPVCISEWQGSRSVDVHQNAAVVCCFQGNIWVIFNCCYFKWHFFQKIAPLANLPCLFAHD